MLIKIVFSFPVLWSLGPKRKVWKIRSSVRGWRSPLIPTFTWLKVVIVLETGTRELTGHSKEKEKSYGRGWWSNFTVHQFPLAHAELYTDTHRSRERFGHGQWRKEPLKRKRQHFPIVRISLSSVITLLPVWVMEILASQICVWTFFLRIKKEEKKQRYRSDSGRLKATPADICVAQTLLELSLSFHGLERGETMMGDSKLISW